MERERERETKRQTDRQTEGNGEDVCHVGCHLLMFWCSRNLEGDEDRQLRRGVPLFLSESIVDHLRVLFLHCLFDSDTVVLEASSKDRWMYL
jgi:hypothetical protein